MSQKNGMVFVGFATGFLAVMGMKIRAFALNVEYPSFPFQDLEALRSLFVLPQYVECDNRFPLLRYRCRLDLLYFFVQKLTNF